jgi:hypothetical protein
MRYRKVMNFAQYKDFVKLYFITLFSKKETRSIVRFAPFIARFFLFDLDYLRTLLESTYQKSNNKPRDPVPLLRSLLLMTLVKETSITHWVQRLRDEKYYAILSGFDPEDVPGVGTFYDFIDRLTRVDKQFKRKQRNRRKKFKRKPSKKLKKNEKLPPKHPNITERIVDKIMKNIRFAPALGKYSIIYKFFLHCIIEKSGEMGLLGNVEKLSIAGDGTHVKTGASPYGKKICDCPKFIIKNGAKVFNKCECSRKFSDSNAVWGWDSYREQWVYGYSFYELATADTKFDLPIFFIQTQANRHDSVSGPIALDIVNKLLPGNYNIAEFMADSAHDNMPTYKLLQKLGIEAFIALNERNTGNFTYKQFPINEQGVPICPAGQAMIYCGNCYGRMRTKWRCPLKASKDFIEKDECQQNNYCSVSQYGRVVYTSHKDNPRLFAQTPRGTEQWLNKYDKRSSVERSNKRKKIDFRLEQARVRSKEHWFIRYTLAAICQHLDAWAKTTDIDFKELCQSWQDEALA